MSGFFGIRATPNMDESTVSFFHKVRDSFELVLEKMADMEATIRAHRRETNEGMMSLHSEIFELRQQLNAKFNDDRSTETSFQSAAGYDLPNDIEQLLNAPICSPFIQRVAKPKTQSEEAIQEEYIEETTLIEHEIGVQQIQEEYIEEPTPVEEPAPIEQEIEESAPIDQLIEETKPSYMGTTARRNRQDIPQDSNSSSSDLSDNDSIGSESDEEENLSRVSFCRSEATDDLPVNYDYEIADDELSTDPNGTPVQSQLEVENVVEEQQETTDGENTMDEQQEIPNVEGIVDERQEIPEEPKPTCSPCGLLKENCECLDEEEDEEDDLVSVFQRNTISTKDDKIASSSTTSSTVNEVPGASESQKSVFKTGLHVDKPSETNVVEQQLPSPQPNVSSPNRSIVSDDGTIAKPVFGKPAFGNAYKTFGSLVTDAPSFLKKLDPKHDPFVVKSAEHKIFTASPTSNNPSSSSAIPTSPISAPNPSAAASKLAGLAPGVTGEEGEIVWLDTRCRIFQFFSKNDIRERGVGQLRLLENPVTSTLRCVMRREQIQKVCANFKITPKFNVVTSNSGKQILTWNCLDFSDPEKQSGDAITFICRFENEETANLFKKLVHTYASE